MAAKFQDFFVNFRDTARMSEYLTQGGAAIA